MGQGPDFVGHHCKTASLLASIFRKAADSCALTACRAFASAVKTALRSACGALVRAKAK